MSTEIKKADETILVMPSTEEIGQLKNMKRGHSLNVKYKTKEDWEQIKGQSVFAYFMGFKEIPNADGELIKCACLAEESGVFVAAQMTLVKALEGTLTNSAVEITYLGSSKNKTSAGSTMKFDIYILEE